MLCVTASLIMKNVCCVLLPAFFLKKFNKDLFIGPQEFVVGYSKAPEQPQSSARPMCRSGTMMNTGHEPATIRIAASIYMSSPRYALRHGRHQPHCEEDIAVYFYKCVYQKECLW